MVTKTENTAALPLSKVAEVLDALAAATGERDPEKLLDMVKTALETPMAPVDMAADPEMAAVLAKAATSVPSAPSSIVGLGFTAEEEFNERRRHFEWLCENDPLRKAAGGSADHVRALRGDAE